MGKTKSKIKKKKRCIGYLNEAKIGSVDFLIDLAEGEIPSSDSFTESTYKDSNDQERPNYLLTKQVGETV